MTADTPRIPYSPSESRLESVSPFGSSLSAEAFTSWGSMEGVYSPVVTRVKGTGLTSVWAPLAPGYAMAAGVVLLAFLVHRLPFAPFTVYSDAGTRHPVSTAIIALIVGLLLRNTLPLPVSLKVGCKSVVKKIIPVSIVLMGAGLNMATLASVGLKVMLITMVCIAIALVGGYYLGRLIGLNWKTALLLATGTGICGNSAIVAVAPLIDADDDDLVLSVGAVNLLGLVAMLVWPMVGGLLHLTDDMFGVWAGTSIHAVPQVVAAGFAFSPDAGTLATLVKLVRVTMLAPLVFVLAMLYAKHHQGETGSDSAITVRYARLVPWFVWGFVAFAILNTLGLLPTLNFKVSGLLTGSGIAERAQVSLVAFLTGAGKVLLALAMAAIGLEVNLRVLAGVGRRAVSAGIAATLVLGASSLLLVYLFI